ncbi:MAG TPA: hypothetical protein VG708_15575 [Mycobacteriales bacterium]|nr:hypothetical protein [Mycobacteriales bacterium]
MAVEHVPSMPIFLAPARGVGTSPRPVEHRPSRRERRFLRRLAERQRRADEARHS